MEILNGSFFLLAYGKMIKFWKKQKFKRQDLPSLGVLDAAKKSVRALKWITQSHPHTEPYKETHYQSPQSVP
jgi:hypothetical protein